MAGAVGRAAGFAAAPLRRRVGVVTSVSVLTLLAVFLATPLIGPATIDYARAVRGESPDREILFDARVPRVLLALLAGGALTLAGVLFQALVRDALADPYTLGISSGASLGAVVAITLGLRQVGGYAGVGLAAFLGAGLTLAMVAAIATRGYRMSSFTLLLAGVTVNSFSMAMILFLHNLADVGQSFAIMRWLMGGIELVDYRTLGMLAAIVLPVAAYVFLHAREWNLLAVGEEWAAARGVAVGRVMFAGYLAGSALTGAVTALTGPIGFIGLILPHALRLWLGADHRVLAPAAFFGGAAFLALCDTAARTVLSPTEIPVAVITAMLGGPFFLWLLRSRRRSLWL